MLKYEQYLQDNKIKSVIIPFTKIEKMKTNKYKPPRMIQARHQIFNILYGRYIKPLEHYVIHHPYLGRHFGKGTIQTISNRINKLRCKYTYYTEGDHKTFDAHVTIQHKQMLHKFYQSCYNHNSELRDLSKRTINNTCITRDNIKYKVKGTVMSGDVDTSFGNCLINIAILKDCLQNLNIKGEVIVNGDDFLIFSDVIIPTQDMTKLLLTHNMECDLKPSKTRIEDVEFCGSKLVQLSNGTYTLMNNPVKMLDTFGMTHHVHVKRDDYLRDLKICYSYVNLENPIGHHLTKAFNITFPDLSQPTVKSLEASFQYHAKLSQPRFISDGSITESIYRAYPDIDSYIQAIYRLSHNINNHYMAKTIDNIYINHNSDEISIG